MSAESAGPIRFGIVGAGWRAEFFLRVAAACRDRFEVAGIVGGSSGRGSHVAARFGVPLVDSISALTRQSPAFVVTAVPRAANPGVVGELVEAGVPVLTETPPAATVEEMAELWRRVGGAPVEVAEQYRHQPHHAARLAFVASGKLGRVTQAQVSAAHGYHGVSLIRRFLGVGFDEARVTAMRFGSPVVRGPGRGGPPKEESVAEVSQDLAWLHFGGKLGVYDFTGEQYFSWIRGQRLLVRGERGEILDERAVYLEDFATPVRLRLERHQAGPEGNLEGNYLKGYQLGDQWLYRNPLAPAALSDDEIAVGGCLLGMARVASGAPSEYSLAEGCQDAYLALVVQRAIDEGRTVAAARQVWAA